MQMVVREVQEPPEIMPMGTIHKDRLLDWEVIEQDGSATSSILIIATEQLFADTLGVCICEECSHFTVVDRTATSVEHADFEGVDLILIQFQDTIASTACLIERVCRDSEAPVVVVDMPDDIDWILGCLEAGATGYVRQSDSVEHLVNVISSAQGRRFSAEPEVVEALITRLNLLKEQVRNFRLEPDDPVPLSKREEEVMGELIKGLSNTEIAETLSISIGTVKNHVHRIVQKLDARDRHHACFIYTDMMKASEESKTA
jgi:DNA-binding NarL/FixJ family response regulator